MAYVLGFWFADGCMTHDRAYRITFSSNDREHLEAVGEVVQTNIPLEQYKRHGKLEQNFTLTLRSKTLYQQLQRLGGTRRKSLVMELPNIPNAFLADFIRGYFDGDGSVYFTTYLRTKDKHKQTDFRCNFTSGSPKFLNSLRDTLRGKLNLFPRKVCVYGNGNQYKLEYAGKDARRLLEFMYKDLEKAPYLERKFAIYQKYLQSQN